MHLYRHILKQAWEITWRYKYLWFFGLFAALLGNGGEYEIISHNSGQSLGENFNKISETGFFSADTFSNIITLFRTDTANMMVILALSFTVLLLFAFVLWLTVVSQIALVDGSANIIGNRKSSSKSGIKEGLLAGAKNFWPVFGLNVFFKAILFGVFLFVGLPAFIGLAKFDSLVSNLFFVFLFVLLIACAVAISFIVKYAICYVVIRKNSFWESIVEGWRLFAKNWIVSIEMAFILFLINFLVGMALVLVVLILLMPLAFLALMSLELAVKTGFWLIVLFGFILIISLIMLGGAMLASFQVASWTGLFIKLVGQGGQAKIKRLEKNLKKKMGR